MTPFTIEIEDNLLAWLDITKYVRSFDDGSSSEAQIIPIVSLRFFPDAIGNLQGLIDPEINKHRPRLRITEGALVTYFVIRTLAGSVSRNMDEPTLTGYAAVYMVNDWFPLTHTWIEDTPANVIASQCCVRNVADQSGESIAVIWEATLNPTIPGGRYSVQRKSRKDILKELATACGAAVRVSNNGMAFEIYDRPARALTGSATRHFDNPRSLSYRTEEVDRPANAVKVRGEQVQTSRPLLPEIHVTVNPGLIDADGVTTAEASAKVYDATGRPTRHQAIVDDPIDAGDYEEIPVSGCFAVQGVWLNTGTQQAPVKGDRVEPISFTASVITVPDNGTQYFIVTYTQATSVSWSLNDYADRIDGEEQQTTGTLAVSTTNNIGRVRGVFRKSDTNRTGTNFFTGGSFTSNTKDITLGISPGATGADVIIDYDEYNGTPLSASISPSSSLCDEDGIAVTTIGSGTVVGLAVIEASALGQSGEGFLSLLGSAIGSLSVKASPAVLQSAEPAKLTEDVVAEIVAVTNIVENGIAYSVVDVDKKIVSVDSIVLNIVGAVTWSRWVNDEDTPLYRIYLIGPFTAGLAGTVNYKTQSVIDPNAQVSTITATVLKEDGTAVTDGTAVEFKIIGRAGGAVLSSDKEFTSSGEASVQLTAGDPSKFVVQAVAGPYVARVDIEVTDNPVGQEDGTGDGKDVSVMYPSDDEESGKHAEEDSYNAVTGHVSGSRLLLGCDGPLASTGWYMSDGSTTDSGTTDSDGFMRFTNMPPGTYDITADGVTKQLTLSPQGG